MEKQPGCEETHIQSHLAFDAPDLSAGSRSDWGHGPPSVAISNGDYAKSYPVAATLFCWRENRANTGRGEVA
jgi:hypothetical protein